MSNEYEEPRMATIARWPGSPGFGAFVVHWPRTAKNTARCIAKWKRYGAIIEKVRAAELGGKTLKSKTEAQARSDGAASR